MMRGEVVSPVCAAFIGCATLPSLSPFFFFFNDTATTEIYTLSLHDALPIGSANSSTPCHHRRTPSTRWRSDRKSTRLNSSHSQISYAVFCLKKKKREGGGRGQERRKRDEKGKQRGDIIQ